MPRDFVAHGDLVGGQFRAANAHRRGKNLRVVLHARAGSEAGGVGVGAFEGGVADDVRLQAGRDRRFRRVAVRTGDVEHVCGGVDRLNEDDFLFAGEPHEVTDAEAAGVSDGDVGGGGVGGSGVGVGQQRVFDPFVDRRPRRPGRVAERVEQRRFVWGVNRHEIGHVLGNLGKGGTGGIGGFTSERHDQTPWE